MVESSGSRRRTTKMAEINFTTKNILFLERISITFDQRNPPDHYQPSSRFDVEQKINRDIV